MENKKRIGQAFWAALPVTTPIFAGFMFIGAAYGLYASAEGFSFCWPVINYGYRNFWWFFRICYRIYALVTVCSLADVYISFCYTNETFVLWLIHA